jgi:TPR repeat protein
MGAACALTLLGAFWVIALSCATPEKGSRLFDQGRVTEALPLLEAAATKGSASSAYRLGLVLEAGKDAPQDLARALALFTFAAGKDHVPSMIKAGDLSRAVAGDDVTAAKWYGLAAERRNSEAMGKLGAMRLSGVGGPADIDAAIALLRRAAAAGNSRAATALGQALLTLHEIGDHRGGTPLEAATFFKEAGEAGDPEALNRLADLHASGRGVPRDLARATTLRRRASDAGYAPAAYDLGLMYLSGQGVNAYPLEAGRLFERAAAAGHVPAMLKLADMLQVGNGVFRDASRALALYDAAGDADDQAAMHLCRLFAAGPENRRDPNRAARFCGKAAKAGDAASATILGLGMMRGRLPGDAAAAAVLLSQAAWAGNPEAMYAMALLHLAGQGVAGNPAEAFRWCRKAAEAGLPEAKALLAALSEEELPNASNLAKAMEFYREAATSGDMEAGFALGSLLSKGLAGPPDFAEARKWYEKSAKAGDPRAQFNLGLMYLTGKGGPANDKEALHWMLEAARRGDPNARCNVASMTLIGRGAPPDAREAFRWYVLAAGQGFAQAQAMLAGFFYEGRVVPRDFESALFWLSLASRAPGNDPLLLRSAKAKAVLEKRLAPDQLERVAARLAAFKPAGYDPETEKTVLAAIKFLPASARGPGFSATTQAAARAVGNAPSVGEADPKALF